MVRQTTTQFDTNRGTTGATVATGVEEDEEVDKEDEENVVRLNTCAAYPKKKIKTSPTA